MIYLFLDSVTLYNQLKYKILTEISIAKIPIFLYLCTLYITD